MFPFVIVAFRIVRPRVSNVKQLLVMDEHVVKGKKLTRGKGKTKKGKV